MADMSGAALPGWLADRLDATDDADEVRRIGIDVATQLCADLIDAGTPGLHLYALNRPDSVLAICTTSAWREPDHPMTSEHRRRPRDASRTPPVAAPTRVGDGAAPRRSKKSAEISRVPYLPGPRRDAGDRRRRRHGVPRQPRLAARRLSSASRSSSSSPAT
jgi:hypothetical protein